MPENLIRAGNVLQCIVPYWGQEAKTFLRVLEVRHHRTQVRITPAEGRTGRLHAWIRTSEINLAIRSGMMEPVETIRCAACDGTMSLWKGVKSTRHVVVFACNECMETVEV